MPFQRPGRRAAQARVLLLTAPLLTALATPAASADDGVTLKPRKGHLRAGRTLTIIAPPDCVDPEVRSDAFPGEIVRPVAPKGGTGPSRGRVTIAADTAPGPYGLMVTCAGADPGMGDDKLLYAQVDVLPPLSRREHHHRGPHRTENALSPAFQTSPSSLFPVLQAPSAPQNQAMTVLAPAPAAYGRATGSGWLAFHGERAPGGFPLGLVIVLGSALGSTLAGGALGGLWWGQWQRRRADA
ncbi:hypothetical protein AB0L06_05085 [Spirillospora sp. NPDC052269]